MMEGMVSISLRSVRSVMVLSEVVCEMSTAGDIFQAVSLPPLNLETSDHCYIVATRSTIATFKSLP